MFLKLTDINDNVRTININSLNDYFNDVNQYGVIIGTVINTNRTCFLVKETVEYIDQALAEMNVFVKGRNNDTKRTFGIDEEEDNGCSGCCKG